MDVPQQIGQEDQKGRSSTEPHPLREKGAALRGKQKPDHDPDSKDQDRILFLQPDTSDHSKP